MALPLIESLGCWKKGCFHTPKALFWERGGKATQDVTNGCLPKKKLEVLGEALNLSGKWHPQILAKFMFYVSITRKRRHYFPRRMWSIPRKKITQSWIGIASAKKSFVTLIHLKATPPCGGGEPPLLGIYPDRCGGHIHKFDIHKKITPFRSLGSTWRLGRTCVCDITFWLQNCSRKKRSYDLGWLPPSGVRREKCADSIKSIRPWRCFCCWARVSGIIWKVKLKN